MPFRSIVSEKGSWQFLISQYLQKHLSALQVEDPFATKTSGDVVSYLQSNDPIGYAFSVDVEDLFYSVPHDELFVAVRECIERNGEVSFRNSAGVPADSFISLLEFYLQATFITFNDDYYIQRQGICTGSCVAPTLCNIFLAAIDRSLNHVFNNQGVLKAFRYVDDFLIVLSKQKTLTPTHSVNSILNLFKRYGKGLNFTHELPTNGTLQFLDLNLQLGLHHICWHYAPRAQKGLLPYDSAHSKIVKRAIVSSCLESSLTKSCPHAMHTSFHNQIKRLLSAGFPCEVISAVAENLLKKVKKGNRANNKERLARSKTTVVPYMHKVAHNIKKVAKRHGVPVVFSAPRKLAGLCPRISAQGARRRECEIKHAEKFVTCATGVVYLIPLKCGRVYVGQTGRCVNERAGEHQRSIKNKERANLPAHCIACSGCEPFLKNIRILGRSSDKGSRELLEAYHIKTRGENCVSDTSVSLYNAEKNFFERF